ncbi:hypothetical protein GCM10028806_16620 [Spirosoma terrae]
MAKALPVVVVYVQQEMLRAKIANTILVILYIAKKYHNLPIAPKRREIPPGAFNRAIVHHQLPLIS